MLNSLCWSIRDDEEEQRNGNCIMQLLSEVYNQSTKVFTMCDTDKCVFMYLSINTRAHSQITGSLVFLHSSLRLLSVSLKS